MATVTAPLELNKDEILRYSRHLILPEVGMEGQKKLKNAKVLMVGAGGLGAPLGLYLAASGIGRIGIVDFDVVDYTNLQRQVIHGTKDVGKKKLDSAAESMLDINPYMQVDKFETAITSENAFEIIRDYDMVIDGTDNFPTRYLINDACVLLKKPNVYGSIFRFEGQSTIFAYPGGPCYRCLYPEPPPPGMVPSCAEGGVLGVLCATIGSIQTTEAIKVLTGVGEPLIGSLMVYDALEMAFRKIKVRKDPNCPICSDNPRQTALLPDYEAFCGVLSDAAAEASTGSTITVQELKAKIDAHEDYYLIDVREPSEFEIVRIPTSHLIPKQGFIDGSALAALPQNKPIILHCKSGVRSAECLAILKGAGFADATHVAGGVVAWAKQIDTYLPVY